MQDYNDNEQRKNVRRVSNSEGGQMRRPVRGEQTGQPRRPSQGGQPRPTGQPRRPSQGGQPRPTGPSRRPSQGAGGGAAGQPRRPSQGGQPRPAGRPSSGSNGKGQKPRKGSKRPLTPQQAAKKKRKKIVLFIVEIFLLLILVASLWFVNKAKRIELVKIDDKDIGINKEVQQKIEEGTSSMKGYRNIALFGVDSRSKQLEKSTRTDTIMIASINLDTNEVKLISVYRDTWLNLSTDSYSKANAAYAKGGPQQALSMLNMNLDMDITDFVTVGFDGLIDVIDAVGGVEIDVKEAEIKDLNNYQISMSGRKTGTVNANGDENYEATIGVDYTPVTRSGMQTLNGLQATAYARIRYVGNGDFERTARQRTVLTQVAKKAITLNPDTLNKITEAVFDEIATSLELSEILSLLSGIAKYEVGETAGFPFEGYVQTGRVGKASVVIPVDLTKNVSLLHEFLFDEQGYEPSETVKKCSQKISADTKVSYSGE